MVISMKKRHIKKKRNKRKKKTLRRGGMQNSSGTFPVCDTLAQFVIRDENISTYSKTTVNKMTCFIDSLQFLRIISPEIAGLLRITPGGKNGFDDEDVEKTMISIFKNNFEFKAYEKRQEWLSVITHFLLPGHATIAGYSEMDNGRLVGHIFVLGRNTSQQVFYLDPNTCTFTTDNNILNINNIDLFKIKKGKKFFILFRSQGSMSTNQLNEIGIGS